MSCKLDPSYPGASGRYCPVICAPLCEHILKSREAVEVKTALRYLPEPPEKDDARLVRRLVVRFLHDAKVPYKMIGEMLGISANRALQLNKWIDRGRLLGLGRVPVTSREKERMKRIIRVRDEAKALVRELLS